MSAKLLMGLAEENQESEKQIGCMAGIFQVFGRKRLLSGGKNKSIVSGNTRSRKSTCKEESLPSSPQIVMEYNQRNHVEPLTEKKIIQNDFRDVVVDSINGEARSLSIKTSLVEEKEKEEDNLLIHKDSPRPIVSVDLNDSLRVLVRLKEAQWNNSEAPSRFSCDGREISRSKSSTKLREVPRLSLDSREASIKKCNKEVDSKGSMSPRIPYVVAKLMGLEPNNANEGNDDHVMVKNISYVPKQSESVYSQIEKRVKELDFSQSNKDLRALKSILEKMEAKGLLDSQKPSQESQNPKPPIVIMKPKKTVKKSDGFENLSGLRKVKTNDPTSKKKTNAKVQIPHMERSPRPQRLVRDRNEVPGRKSNSSSRAQQRMVEPEKKPKTTQSPRRQNRVLKPNQAQGSSNLNSPCQGNLKIHNEDVSAINLVEQPSPISVLDSSFYQDDLPLSPVKKTIYAMEGLEIDASSLSLGSNTPSKLSKETNLQKFDNIMNLIEKLRLMSSCEKFDYEELHYDYLNQILLFEVPHNQNLIFDVVKEIIVHKFELLSYKPQAKFHNNCLLANICEEIKQALVEKSSENGRLEDEELRIHEDLMKQSNGWVNFDMEMPGLVLDIERSIFRDLIDEIVTGEANFGLFTKGNRLRKQLFM